MRKRFFLFALFFVSCLSACGDREKEGQGGGIYSPYHAFALDGIIVTVQLPETWAYSYEPDYNGMYFQQVFTQMVQSLDEEENITEDVKVLNFHYGTDEGHFSVYQGERTEDMEKWDEYTFPDGTNGLHMVSSRDGRYREELYHEGTGMLVCFDASKSEYKKYKQEIRLVLDSIAFGTKSLPERVGSDGEIVEPYEFHLYEWALKVDLLAKAGVSAEWEGHTLKEQNYGYVESGRYAFGGCERLSYGENGENIMYIGTEILEPNDTEPLKAYTVVLESGMKGERSDFIYEGEEWSYVQIFYPEVYILFHGDEMEQVLQSIRPW